MKTERLILRGEKITFTPEDSDTFLLYEVQQHDLVNRIARHYGVNPNTIARDNHLYKISWQKRIQSSSSADRRQQSPTPGRII